jgi:hypothetical protein
MRIFVETQEGSFLSVFAARWACGVFGTIQQVHMQLQRLKKSFIRGE